jgi:CheY-like chemotaxis protein
MQDDLSPLAGLRILIAEDMYLVAQDIADQLAGLGCEVVGPDGRVKSALKRIESSGIDGALLDVNLGGESSFVIAAELASRHIPFIFLTGYDRETAFPSEFRSSPKLSKPVADKALAQMMEKHFVHH